MIHLIGVDVGASHVESAYAVDEAEPITRASSPGTVVRPGSVPDAAEAVVTSIDAVLPADVSMSSVDCIVVGSAGIHSDSLRLEFEGTLRKYLPDTPLHATTDGAIALASAFGDRPGIVVCAGSGSIAYARDPNGVVSRVGGLGPVLADEGSGYAVGLGGLRAAARALDGRAPPTSLGYAIPSSADISNLDELIDWCWAASRPMVAALAPTVFQEAESGDEVAGDIVMSAAEGLASLVVTLAGKFGADANLDVAFSGGILSPDSPVRRELASIINTELPTAKILEKTADPVVGALSMAWRLRNG